MNIRVAALVVALSVSFLTPASADDPAVSALPVSIAQLLSQRCALLEKQKFDVYANTMTPDFSEVLPSGKTLDRDGYVRFETVDTRGKRVECRLAIRAIYATPTGASAAYLESQTGISPRQSTSYEINAMADFVFDPSAGWRMSHVTVLGNWSAVNAFHGGTGSMDALPTPPPGAGPNVLPTPVPPSIAATAAGVTMPDCAGSAGPGVRITFSDAASVPITRIEFAVVLQGRLLLNPIATGKFSPGATIVRDFTFGHDLDGKRFLVQPVCYVRALTRADGSTWTNPDTSLIPRPTSP
jgi:hypothetical protein